MKGQKSFCLFILCFVALINSADMLAKITGYSCNGDYEYNFLGTFRPEMFFGKNITFLNNNEPDDKIWYARHTVDTKLNILYGAKSYGKTVAECLMGLRNQAVWGNPASIASTTDAEVKTLDAVNGPHSHDIPRLIPWIRELWLRLDLVSVLGLCIKTKHDLTLGLFSFELGRGISLGNAFAVGPGVLGFYTDFNVNQFAPGALVHGELVKDVLFYDFYAAILNNKSSKLADTGARILGQEYGRRDRPSRGFGKINYLIAARLNWYVFASECFGTLRFEPYGLFNNDPEQKVEFPADASSRLGTVGLASEYIHSRFEFGFDCAFNLGQQRVKGWDRNIIELAIDADTNAIKQVNSQVLDQKGVKVAHNPTTPNGKKIQTLINTTPQGEFANGKEFATVGTTDLFNSNRRFSNEYTNEFHGWMFVADAAVWLYKKDLQFAVTAGITSGDDNPNIDNKDGTFDGFISLQEIYSGKRVKSAFVLGGAGKIKRPLSVPDPEEIQAPSPFASSISGFTNLVFTGGSLLWTPRDWKKEFSLNTNVLAYWQEKPTNKFDALARKEIEEKASTFLGTELNLFLHYYILRDVKLFFVGSIFIPGAHYTQVRGLPLDKNQDRALVELLDRLDRTGTEDPFPNLGDHTAYTFNLGLEFRF